MPKTVIQTGATIQTDAEVSERFNFVSPLILDFQKQYFESLKFSLNMWIVINTGAAIALLGKGNADNAQNILGFMAGAVSSGIGNMLLFVFSRDCLAMSYLFISDTKQKQSDLITSLSIRHTKMYWKAALFLSISYVLFIISAINLKFS